MNTKTESLHQQIMNKAYGRWQAAEKSDQHMSQQEFWDQLDADERFAVFTGNLNYQVCNGGFTQWWGNNYAQPEVVDYLIRNCASLGTDNGSAVADLVRRFKRTINGRDGSDIGEDEWEHVGNALGELDNEFYEINEAFMADCDVELQKRMAKKEG